ncbi:MAG: ABC transporter permease, partial [Elainellaceae cyanobacterium]
MVNWSSVKPYALAAPQAIALCLFLVFPIALIAVVSFWEFNGYAMTPAFTLNNYAGIFTSDVTLKTYLNTFKFVG